MYILYRYVLLVQTLIQWFPMLSNEIKILGRKMFETFFVNRYHRYEPKQHLPVIPTSQWIYTHRTTEKTCFAQGHKTLSLL